MDDIILLAVLLIAAFPIAVIYLLISNSGLKRRVAALEAGVTRVVTEPKVEPIDDQSAEEPDMVWPKAIARDDAPVAAESKPTGPPKAVVLTGEKLRALASWITQNWFYAVSAVSLALAGIFLVIYGMEQGLLPPSLRILASLAFGGALVGAGEYIRRRHGDGEGSSTAYLPSTFSGAGIVTLFGAVLAARLLYGFIGPEVALIGMALVGALAMILGWYNGPLLAAVGVIGAMVAPFIIGGSSDTPSTLLLYFGIVTVVGLAIDTLRRWAWVSVISLVSGYAAGTLLTAGAGSMVSLNFTIYCAVLAIAAIAIPVQKTTPNHTGTPLSVSIFARAKGEPWPEFPTRLAGGAVLAASILITLVAFETGRIDLFWTAIAVLSGLILALMIWARNAPALVDLAVLPAVGLVVMVASGGRIWETFRIAAAKPEADMPMMASTIVAIGLFLSIMTAWRSLRGGSAQLFVALGAAVLAPAMAIVMEIFWQPAEIIGTYVWALHAMVIGGVMVVTAERFARIDGPTHRDRVSFAILSALACIAFALIILFSSAALTSAIAITIVAAAWLDRQFNLPLMGLYILAGITFVGYRLVIDPGVDWAADAPLPEMLLSHAGAVLAFGLSYLLVKSVSRPKSEVLLESAIFSSTGILLSILLLRTIENWSGGMHTTSHWSVGMAATIWIALGMAQLHRVKIGGALAKVRIGLGAIFLALGASQILIAAVFLNPLFHSYTSLILGPRVFTTLIPAYLLPAAVLALGAWWLRSMPKAVRLGFVTVSLALAGLWLTLTIRHFWRGALGMELPGVDQPELYSYTVALLIIGAGLFYQSLARPNALLRKAGLLFIGLVVAKVFFVDIRGLGGLIRVFSLLFLGLSLAGLAWLNRWAAARSEQVEKSALE